MKLLTKKFEVKITNKDLNIEEEFEIIAEPLSQSELMAFYSEFENKSEIEMGKQMFIETVKYWKGLKDEEDNELKCDKKTKEIIFKNNPDFCAEITNLIMEKANDFKKKLNSTSDGKKKAVKSAEAV